MPVFLTPGELINSIIIYILEGEKTPQQKNKIGVYRAFWAASGILDPRIVSSMPPGKKRIGKIENLLDGSQVLAKLRFLLRQALVFQQAELVVYRFGWSFLPVLVYGRGLGGVSRYFTLYI